MSLSNMEISLFFKLYLDFLVYVNNTLRVSEKLSGVADFQSVSMERKDAIRNAWIASPGIIDDYIRNNPGDFTQEELGIVKGWEKFVSGDLCVFRFLKEYTVFLDWDGEDPKAYGVHALSTPIEQMVPNPPMMIKGVLLPFNGKIVSDGILSLYRVFFGSGYKRSMTEGYNEAKAKYGIITDLMAGAKENHSSDKDMLIFYLKNKANREKYAREIQMLVGKNEELNRVYHQETGKSDAIYYGKRLRETGVEAGWFAILEGLIVASGETCADVENIVGRLIPHHKLNHVYYYQLKRRKN